MAALLMSGAPDTLQTVTVVADRGVAASRTDTLKINHSQSIAELLQHSPGISVSDNGGLAGLKTVSLRGMGSPHTTIYIDGIRVGNVQSGQSDIGSLGIENLSSAVIDYAQNSVSFITARPAFLDGRKIGGNARFSAGSFGTYLPSARFDWKMSDKLSLSANAAGVFSNGNFSYGDGLKRENNDIKEARGGIDLFGNIRDGDWHAKIWYNSSDRGTPGSTSWPSTDRQKDRNIFAQGLLRNQFSNIYSLNASVKVAYDGIAYSSSWGDSRYGQTEAQFNSSHKFNVNRCLILSVAADAYWDGLKSTVYDQQRFGATGAFSAAFRTAKFTADLALQYDGVFDKGHQERNSISPSLDMRFNAFEGFDILAFARRAYRVPTFNELYYVGYGNPDLKPEDAWLTDIGIDWRKTVGTWHLKAKIDGFYNYLRDKITSAPSAADPNIWMPYNIGKVRSAGADLLAGFDYSHSGWSTSFTARYGFQDAVDKTPDSYTSGQQIAYIARHNLSLDALASIKGWSAQAVWVLRAGRRDSAGDLPDWNTLDLFFIKAFNLGDNGIPALKISLKNVTDTRYELASGYPMPGFSITGGVEYKF